MRAAEREVAVERPTYDLTVFKPHCGKLALKIHSKGERVRRIEAVAHNIRGFHCGRLLDNFPEIVRRIGSTRRDEPLPPGPRAIAALLVLRDKAIKPLLAAAQVTAPNHAAQNPRAIDRHCQDLQRTMQGPFMNSGSQPDHRQIFCRASPLSA
jgi:hypothetical protein